LSMIVIYYDADYCCGWIFGVVILIVLVSIILPRTKSSDTLAIISMITSTLMRKSSHLLLLLR
jgi:hypothetical protein